MATTTNYTTQEELLKAISEKLGEATASLVKAELADLNNKIDGIAKLDGEEIASLVDKINTISKVLDGDEDGEFSVQNIIKIITDNQNAVKTLQDALNAAQGQIKGLDSKIADVTKSVGDVSTKIDGVNNDLTAKIGDVAKQASTLEDTLKTAQTEIEAVKNSIPKIDDSAADANKLFSSAKIQAIADDLKTQIANKTQIDDSVTAATTTFSSTKIESLLNNIQDVANKAIEQAKTDAINKALEDAQAEIQKTVSSQLTVDVNSIFESFENGWNKVMSSDTNSTSTTTTSNTSSKGDAATL